MDTIHTTERTNTFRQKERKKIRKEERRKGEGGRGKEGLKKGKKKGKKEGKVKKDKKMGQVLYNECKVLILELSFGFSGFCCCFCF